MMTRSVTPLRNKWKFTRNVQPDAFDSVCDDSGWENVQVPHDWAIAALCNGDATALESFKETAMKAYNGMAVVYLRSIDGGSGDITLKATTEDLPPARVQLKTGTRQANDA